MTPPRELVQFLLLSPEDQAQAVRRLAAAGWKNDDIAKATRLSVEQIRKVTEAQAPVKCARTGIPTQFCTCIGPHEVTP